MKVIDPFAQPISTSMPSPICIDGPMFCTAPSCVAFRQRDPVFAGRLQAAGIIAHYWGYEPLFREEVWTTSALTPVTRSQLERMMSQQDQAKPSSVSVVPLLSL